LIPWPRCASVDRHDSPSALGRLSGSGRGIATRGPWLIVWLSVVFALVDSAPAAAFGCFEEPATIVGTPGDDVLVGTTRKDVIVGRGGNDLIRGRGGGDLICAGRGDDIVYRGSGANVWSAVLGNMGDDLLVGGPRSDFLDGGWGNDTLRGHEKGDFLDGSEGSDVLRGGWGNDHLVDGPGDDVVLGGLGSDELEARNGAGGDDVYSSGGGIRDALLFRGDRVSVDLSLGQTLDEVFGNDRFVGPWDVIEGTIRPDTLIGDAGPNQIFGGQANDHIEGRAGDDRLVGGTGTDLLDGGDGTDECLEGETVLLCE
jgi:Ca2+-binding RTX toxin-like protein